LEIPVSMAVVRVLSWNVNGRVGAALANQLDAVLSQEPDVVALQEVTVGSYTGWSSGLMQADFSLVSTIDLVTAPYPPPPYPMPPFPRAVKREGQIGRKYLNVLGRAILSPLAGLSFTDPDEARFAFPEKYMAARTSVAGLELEIHNGHLPPGVSRGVVKVHAFEAIRRRIDAADGVARILCGDFNAPWTENEDGPIVARGGPWSEDVVTRWFEAESSVVRHPHLRDVYRDVHDRNTAFPASHLTAGTPRRYDYVFASPELTTMTCEYRETWLKRDAVGKSAQRPCGGRRHPHSWLITSGSSPVPVGS
jgi:exonuclease III